MVFDPLTRKLIVALVIVDKDGSISSQLVEVDSSRYISLTFEEDLLVDPMYSPE